MGSTPAARFEAQYQALRERRAPGWGGDQYERRLHGWQDTLDRLDTAGLLPPSGARVLELGGGAGMVTRLLVARGYVVDSVELSETAVTWAREQSGPLARHHVGDAVDLRRWAAGTQRLVVDANCLHCIVGDDRARCLGEVRRVLEPGGSFLVSSMVGPPGELPEGLHHADGQLVKDGEPVRTLSVPATLVGELAAVGFEVVFEHLAHNPWWDHLTLLLRAPR